MSLYVHMYRHVTAIKDLNIGIHKTLDNHKSQSIGLSNSTLLAIQKSIDMYH